MTFGAAHSDVHENGRKLTLFLVDGSPTGLIVAELDNWSGRAVVAPRTALAELLKRPESGRCGVYLLIGEDKPGRNRVYVGEGDNVGKRLKLHQNEEGKAFFGRICIIVSGDDSLNKADVRYLEAKLMELVRDAGRAELDNSKGSRGDKGLQEADAAAMNRFLSEIKTLAPVLGFDVLRVAGEADGPSARGDDVRYVFNAGGTDAKAEEIGGEFVVLAGSLARVEETSTIDDTARQRRDRYRKDGWFAETDDGKRYKLTRNIPFPSSSAAAAVVYGGRISGPQTWKSETDGVSYKDLNRRKLDGV